jgi:phosphoglucomutase
MTTNSLLSSVEAKAKVWLEGPYDEATKNQVKALFSKEDKADLIDAFYQDLEFGTGGLRGIMGVGTNRMNIYTVGAATQGLANYLKKEFASIPQIKVVIGYDCRNNSKLFAQTVADIFSANGIKAYIFEDLRPTPEISFAIRHFGCQSGVIITASHNPKEYNGYKAYWNDGGQLIAPHDKNVITEVNKIQSVDSINFKGNPALIEVLGHDMDELFLEQIKSISLDPAVIQRQKDLKIVYTPIHGTGVKLVPAALQKIGFTNIISVPEQNVVSGDFPTVISPNPEEPAALEMAVNKAVEVGADIVMASDPDADRLGIAVRDDKGEFVLVNGNQTAVVLTWYMLKKWKETGKLTGNEFIVKTIVTSEILKEIAVKNGVGYYDVYTGFKWIAGIIRELEGKKKYICGGEESYGFLPGDYVRDKDAVGAITMMAEIAAWAKDNGITVYQLMQDIYLEYGFSKERMKYVVRKGQQGAEEIRQIMQKLRQNPPAVLAGSKLALIKDYASLTAIDKVKGTETKIDLPVTSDVLQFFTEDGSKISVRPSGTEPKIKFYFEVKYPITSRDQWDTANKEADARIDKMLSDMGL